LFLEEFDATHKKDATKHNNTVRYLTHQKVNARSAKEQQEHRFHQYM
jgi:hypothetical protein